MFLNYTLKVQMSLLWLWKTFSHSKNTTLTTPFCVLQPCRRRAMTRVYAPLTCSSRSLAAPTDRRGTRPSTLTEVVTTPTGLSWPVATTRARPLSIMASGGSRCTRQAATSTPTSPLSSSSSASSATSSPSRWTFSFFQVIPFLYPS